MNDPIVIDPPGFDQTAAWDECREFVDKCGGLSYPGGETNWRAMFGADPGVVSCPACNEYYWMWGRVQKCSKCGFVYPTDWWQMFSWGSQASRSGSFSYRHDERLSHPYYRFGFENPPDGDVFRAAHEVDWRTVIDPWPTPTPAREGSE